MSDSDLEKYVSVIETRVHSHYRDDVISLGTITELFGMAGGKLSYMFDGDAGLMRHFENVEFLAPALDGDYLRVTVKLLAVGRTSRMFSGTVSTDSAYAIETPAWIMT